MTTPRRSGRHHEQRSTSDTEIEPTDKTKGAPEVLPKTDTTQHSNKSEKRETERKLRRLRRDTLRARATGKITTATDSRNTRILFDDDDADQQDRHADVAEELSTASQNHVGGAHDDDEGDDDVVEEMQGSVAKKLALTQDKVEAMASVKKRKRKNRLHPVEMKDDKAFFEELDSELQGQQLEKLKKKKNVPQGFHTTFVEESNASNRSRSMGSNIEVVVSSSSSFSRTNRDGTVPRWKCVLNGADVGSSERKRKKRPLSSSGWKRSGKTRRILTFGPR